MASINELKEEYDALFEKEVFFRIQINQRFWLILFYLI